MFPQNGRREEFAPVRHTGRIFMPNVIVSLYELCTLVVVHLPLIFPKNRTLFTSVSHF